MNSEDVRAVFFDIGNTLAAVELDGAGERIERLHVLEGVPEVLGELRGRGLRLGIISDRGRIAPTEVTRALRAAGLLNFFERGIIIFGPKDSSSIFRRAAQRAGLSPSSCLFIGENENERRLAEEAGMKTAADARSALPGLGGLNGGVIQP